MVNEEQRSERGNEYQKNSLFCISSTLKNTYTTSSIYRIGVDKELHLEASSKITNSSTTVSVIQLY